MTRAATDSTISGIRNEQGSPAMTTSIEIIPQVWDEERDGQFFRLTVSLFGTDFCSGATVLLASYDVEDVTSTVTASSTTSNATMPDVTTTTVADVLPDPAHRQANR